MSFFSATTSFCLSETWPELLWRSKKNMTNDLRIQGIFKGPIFLYNFPTAIYRQLAYNFRQIARFTRDLSDNQL
jgi:hypothetical protein